MEGRGSKWFFGWMSINDWKEKTGDRKEWREIEKHIIGLLDLQNQQNLSFSPKLFNIYSIHNEETLHKDFGKEVSIGSKKLTKS